MALRPGAPVSSTSSVLRLLLPINALAGNLHIGAPAGNKSHLAEKSTPVWLAIWAFVRSGAFFSLHLYHTTSFLSGLSRIIAFINICIFGHLQSYECFFSIPQNGELTLRKFGDSKLLITPRVQKWGFCAFLGCGTLILGPFCPMITRRYLGLRAEEREEVYNVLEF